MMRRGRFTLWISPTKVRLQGKGVCEEATVLPGADAHATALELALGHCLPGSELKIFSAALPLFITRWQPPSWRERRPPPEILPLELKQLTTARLGPWVLAARKEPVAAWLAEFARACLWVTKLAPLVAGYLPEKATAQEVRLIDDDHGWTALLIVHETFVRVEPLPADHAAWPDAIAAARAELNREEPDTVPVAAWQDGERDLPVEGLKDMGPPAKLSRRLDLRDPQSQAVVSAALWRGPLRAAAAALAVVVVLQAVSWQELRTDVAEVEAERMALEARLAELKADRFMAVELPLAEATARTLAPARREEERLQRMLELLDNVAQDIPHLHFTDWRMEGETVTLSGLLWTFDRAEADRDPEVPANFQVLLDKLNDHLGVEVVRVEPQEPGRLAFTFRLEEQP